ncbi:hypothetical protein [Paenibacillus sp. DMB20]|uniref:hypothetical protein n=1 Tax=Paenibacillus sp. DMB20 TaxID=1642570 RepID=UPI0006281BA1|nr:hypothetical protein [Paenibacillus sp. DMB20]KKO52839.1 hypothetical protein XI25_16475 [Paenibacillus sp. DMB20]
MIYIKAKGLEDNELYYFEVDQNRAAHRQITVADERCVVSAFPDFQLCETEVELFEGDTEITKEEFDRIWFSAMESYRERWESIKAKYVPGVRVTGEIAMFYPQGVIIRIEKDVYAIAAFEEIASVSKPEFRYPGYRVDGLAAGYDEANCWLRLEGCYMTGEKLSRSVRRIV